MSMWLGLPEDEESGLNAEINTTPLVDVMLVLLIIFLITVPAAIETVPVTLPEERNVPTQTRPENVTIAVDRQGNVFWNRRPVADRAALLERMKAIAAQTPQPEIHIRGDRHVRYEAIGEVVVICQRAGIRKVGFIMAPPRGGEAG